MTLPYPEEYEDRFEAVEKNAPDLFSSAQNRAPYTEASAGLILPNRGEPDDPPSGVHIFAEGDEFYVKTADGVVRGIIPDPFPQGAAVVNPPNFTSGSASGSDAVVINALRADAAGTKVALDHLLASLRAAGLIRT